MIEIKNLSRYYRSGKREVKALDDLSLNINAGEFVVIRGSSGSGKTTLLLSVGGMLNPTSGEIIVDGQNLYALNGSERTRFRSKKIGFVFQMFYLLPYITVLDNVMLPTPLIDSHPKKDDAVNLLENFGLSHRIHHFPSELSAGEKQRTAIARAIINQPKIILADEPTGNLDPENAEQAFKILSDFHKQGGTVLVVTHGKDADQYADRIISLSHGKIVKN
jgi:putative ABC transport system ATP-binding protein